MKKLSLFAVALALTVFVACKEKDSEEPNGEEENMEQVDTNASDEVNNNGEELTVEEDVFAVDLDE